MSQVELKWIFDSISFCKQVYGEKNGDIGNN